MVKGQILGVKATLTMPTVRTMDTDELSLLSLFLLGVHSEFPFYVGL